MRIGVKYLGMRVVGQTLRQTNLILLALVVGSSMLISGCSTPCKDFEVPLGKEYELTLATVVGSITFGLAGPLKANICESHGIFLYTGNPLENFMPEQSTKDSILSDSMEPFSM